MNHETNILWEKIAGFKFDEPETEFTFSKRLARENGWAINYSEAVIDEYKKFIFLCCISEKPVAPSDQVDQVWHLHLSYTRSYWKDLCKNILGKEIHHDPTKGGNKEAEKFEDCYTHTFKLYYDIFNELPPKSIWLNNKERFSDIHFQRINIKKNWVIKKPKLKFAVFIIPLILAGAIINIGAENSTGFYIFLCIVAILIIREIIKGKSNNNGGGSGGGCSSGTNYSDGDSGCSSSGCSGCGGGD